MHYFYFRGSAYIFLLLFSSGMMIESMAGKSASLNGLAYDATPFTFSEEDPAIEYFGNLLKQCMVFPSV